MSAAPSEAPLLVFFSSVSGSTARFVKKLGLRARRIPLHSRADDLVVDEPFVLVTPTYDGGEGRGVERECASRKRSQA